MCSLDFSTIQCCSLKEKKKVDKSWEVLLLRHSFLWHSTPTVKLSCLCCALLVMSDSLWPHGLWPTRLLCPWYFPGKKTRVGYHFLLQGNLPNPGIEPGTLCDPMDCSLPGSSVHGIFQARVLECGAIAFSAQAMRHSQNKTKTKNTWWRVLALELGDLLNATSTYNGVFLGKWLQW